MKRSLAIAGSFLLILAAVCCTMGALISAFSFDADARYLFPVWLCASLVLSIIVSLLRVKGILILSLPVLVMFFWRLSEIIEGGKWAIYYITTEYNKWLYVPVLFPNANAPPNGLTLFFAFLGIVLAFIIAAPVCLQRSAFYTILFTSPFVFLTVVLIETTPDVRCLLGLLTVYMTLIISSSLYPYNLVKRGISLFPALALSIVLLGFAYLIVPPDSYKRGNIINDVDEYLRDTAERVGVELNKKGIGWPDSMAGQWSFNTDRVGIADAGTRTITDRSILEINVTKAGTFYLRGFSMLAFDGRAWLGDSDTQSSIDESIPRRMPAIIVGTYSQRYPDGSAASAEMTISKTGDSSDLIYQPYYSLPLMSIEDYPYSVIFYHTEDSILGMYDALASADSIIGGEQSTTVGRQRFDMSSYSAQAQAPSIYTQIEESTATGLRQLAIEAGIDPEAGRAEVADMVAEFISSSARYTLTPYITPEGEDFALYFLQTSKRGYCIHFATTATLMLRALDIPARFTSGFVATVRTGSEGNTTTVTDRNAHAWVEVYYEDIGWIPLEVTPAYPGSGIPVGAPHHSDTAISDLVSAASGENGGLTGEPYDGYTFPEDSFGTYIETESAQSQGESAEAGGQTDSEPSGPGGSVMIAASITAILIIAIILRSVIARKYRKKQFAQADTNKAVLYIWHYASRLSRRESPPEEIENLALKARFSQHRITEEERTGMLVKTGEYYAEVCSRRNIFGRIWIKYLY